MKSPEQIIKAKSKICKEIKQKMKDQGVTYRELSVRCGDVGESAIHRIVNEKTNASVEMLFKIAKQVGMVVEVRSFDLPEKPVDKE